MWITLAAFLFLVGSFFFFMGSALSLFSYKTESGEVAVVEVLGGIFDSHPVVETLRDMKKDKSVKAVVLRIDSPGGSVGASQEIFEAVKELKGVKPVVASMGSVAASGGYYIALGASRIVANAGTVTGSIGVRMELMNVEDLAKWLKVQPITLKSGRLKDAGSPTRPMTDEEKAYLESVLQNMHKQFKAAVSESRGLSAGDVDALADGRVFTGEEALQKRLIDEMGALDKAVAVAANLAGLKGEPEIFFPKPEKHDVLDYLMDGLTERFFKRLNQSVWTQARFSY